MAILADDGRARNDPDWLEEERKRKQRQQEQARQAAEQRAMQEQIRAATKNLPVMPIPTGMQTRTPSTAKPIPKTTVVAPGQFQRPSLQPRTEPKSIVDMPRADIDKTVQAAKDYLARQDQTMVNKDPLTYWKNMERALGAEGMDARVQGVWDIYQRYLSPLDPKELMFDMIRSPFKLNELEAMAKQAGLVTNNKMPGQTGYVLPDAYKNKPPAEKLAGAITGYYNKNGEGLNSVYIETDPTNVHNGAVVTSDEAAELENSRDRVNLQVWYDNEKWNDEFAFASDENEALFRNAEVKTGVFRDMYGSWEAWSKAVEQKTADQRLFNPNSEMARAYDDFIQQRTQWIQKVHGVEQAKSLGTQTKFLVVDYLTWGPGPGKLLKFIQWGGKAYSWMRRADAAGDFAKSINKAANEYTAGRLALEGAGQAVSHSDDIYKAAAEADKAADTARSIANQLKAAGRFGGQEAVEKGVKGYYAAKTAAAGAWGFNKMMSLTRGGYFLWKTSNMMGPVITSIEGEARAAGRVEVERETFEASLRAEEALEADPYTSGVDINVAIMGMGTEEQMTRASELYAQGQLLESYMFQQLAANDTDAIIRWQTQLKTAQGVDPLTGAPLRGSYAKDLVADGIMTPEWWAELRRYSRDQERDTADMQMQLKAMNFASEDMEITGSFYKWNYSTGEWEQDERWLDAFNNAQEEWARQSAFAKDHPLLSVIQTATKFPMTEHGWKALYNSLSGEGKFYIPLKVMSKVAATPGALWNGQMGALDLMMRMANNPTYQGMAEDIIQAVENQGVRSESLAPTSFDPSQSQFTATMITEDGKWDMGIGEAMDRIEAGEVDLNAEVADGKTLGDLVKAYQATAATMLEETHGADYISTAANFFGADYEGMKQWNREHPDLTHAINMTTDIVLQVMLMKGGAAIRRPVRRNTDAFMKSHRATRDVSRFLREVNKGNARRARMIMGGSDSIGIVTEIMKERYKNPTKDMPDMVNAAREISTIVKDTNLTDAQKATAILDRYPTLGDKLKNGTTFIQVILNDFAKSEVRQAEKTTKVEEGHAERRAKFAENVTTRYRTRTDGSINDLKTKHEGEATRLGEKYDRELNRKDTSSDKKLEKTRVRVEAQRQKKVDAENTKFDAEMGLRRQTLEAEIAKIRTLNRQRKINATERDRRIAALRDAAKEVEGAARSAHETRLSQINHPFDRKIADAEALAAEERIGYTKSVQLRRVDAEIFQSVRHDREMLELFDRHIYNERVLLERKLAKWDADNPVPDSTLVDFDTSLMQRLVARQKGRGDIIGTKTFSLDEMKSKLADYYGGRFEQARNPVTKELEWIEEADGTKSSKMNATKTYYDIFPHLTLPGLKRVSRTRMGITNFLANDSNWGPLKPLMEAMYTPLLKAPGLKASTAQADIGDMVFDFVACYSGSIAHAERWGNRAVLTDFSNPSAIRAFETALHADKARYVKTGEMHSSLTQKIDEVAARSSDISSSLGDQGPTQIGTPFTAKMGGEVDAIIRKAEKEMQRARTPEERKAAAEALNQVLAESGRVGAWKNKAGESGQVTLGTTKAKYTIRLGRDVMWANLKTLDGTDAFGHALNFTRTNKHVVAARNVWRMGTAAAQTLSTPLRIISVGSGAINLFGKHSLADTMRSLADEGLSVMRYKAHKKAYNNSLKKMDAQTRAKVLLDEAASMEGEYHWQAEGGSELVWTQAKAFDQRGHMKHKDESIQAIRNIIQDEGFMIYTKLGHQGMAQWLSGSEGVNWLVQSGAVKRAKKMYDEADVPLKEEELIQMAREQYIDDMVKLFQDYSTMPKLFAEMERMGKGEIVPTDSNIQNALVDAYNKSGGFENPTLEIAYEKAATGTGAFVKLTKFGMTPNRVNRGLVFQDIYSKTFKRLKKDGLDDNAAAMVASGVARLRTQQVHFDLSSAMKFEAKNRWYAWFGTKHRLWSTWIMKTAATKPLYAAAFNEFTNWMSERNKDEGTPEWEKYNITIPIGGSHLSINMAPWLWLTSYAQESIIGYALQNEVIGGFNAIFGTDIQAAPREFDFSLTRLDAPIRAISRRIHLGEVKEIADIQTALENMPLEDRRKVQRNMAIVWVDSGKTKDWVECYREVIISGIAAEMHRMFKPASSRLIHANDLKRREQEATYAKMTDPEKRFRYLQDNPDFAAIIGARDRLPWEQAEITAYYEGVRAADEKMEAEMDNIYRTKGIFTQDVVQEAHRKYNLEIERLGELYPKGEADANVYGADEINQIIKFYLPDTENPVAWKKQFSVPTLEQEQEERKRLTESAQDYLIAAGLDPTSDSLGVRLIKQRLIEDKLDDFMKRNTGSYTYGEENNARWLARSTPTGDAGLLRQTQYLEMVIDNKKRNLWVRGLKNGKADKSNLMGMFLSADEKEFLGIMTDPATEQAWMDVAIAKQRVDDYLDNNGIERQSKIGKEKYKEVDAVIAQNWDKPNFRFQMNLSLMNTSGRMRLLGFTEGGSNASKGWESVLDIVDEVWRIAANEYNQNTKSKGVSIRTAQNSVTHPESAAKIKELMRKIVAVSKSNKDWFTEWQLMEFSMSKFGFYQPIGDLSDIWLGGEHDAIDLAEYDEQWGVD